MLCTQKIVATQCNKSEACNTLKDASNEYPVQNLFKKYSIRRIYVP